MNANNETDCDYECEDARVNSICGSMSPADILLSLTLECPRDCRSQSCVIKEVVKWRKMDIKQAFDHISALPLSEQKKLVEEHRKCSSANSNNR